MGIIIMSAIISLSLAKKQNTHSVWLIKLHGRQYCRRKLVLETQTTPYCSSLCIYVCSNYVADAAMTIVYGTNKGFPNIFRSTVYSEIQIPISFMLCASFLTALNCSLALSTLVDTIKHGCEERKEVEYLWPKFPDSRMQIQCSPWAKPSTSFFSHPTTWKKERKDKEKT